MISICFVLFFVCLFIIKQRKRTKYELRIALVWVENAVRNEVKQNSHWLLLQRIEFLSTFLAFILADSFSAEWFRIHYCNCGFMFQLSIIQQPTLNKNCMITLHSLPSQKRKRTNELHGILYFCTCNCRYNWAIQHNLTSFEYSNE